MISEHGSIQSYARSIRAIPLLSADEERQLARAYRSTGDTAAAHRLVTANLRFVILIARRYLACGVRLPDLVQEGNIGLMEAVKRFDPDKGVRLLTYASWWIRACIRQYLLRSAPLVRTGTGESDLPRFARGDVSLETPADDALDRLAELATDEESSPETGLTRAQEGAVLRQRVADALALLDARERFVVGARLMSEDPMSLREVGDHFGCSQGRVQQLQNRARRKLREQFEASGA